MLKYKIEYFEIGECDANFFQDTADKRTLFL